VRTIFPHLAKTSGETENRSCHTEPYDKFSLNHAQSLACQQKRVGRARFIVDFNVWSGQALFRLPITLQWSGGYVV
jgi:hypothetical protein